MEKQDCETHHMPWVFGKAFLFVDRPMLGAALRLHRVLMSLSIVAFEALLAHVVCYFRILLLHVVV